MQNLSILITHHRQPQLLRNLLQSFRREIGDGKLKMGNYELIVVDSEAESKTRVLVRNTFPGAIYIPFSRNVGYAKIVNAGIKRARAKFLLILNTDICITLKEIEKMRSFLESKRDAAAVGVTDCFRFPTIASLLARRGFLGWTRWGTSLRANYEMKDYRRKKPLVVDWVRGDCWMITRRALNVIGYFDERFFMYFEDTDWCRRAHNAGYAIYFFPNVQVTQLKRGASRQYTLKGLIYRVIHFISFIKYLIIWNR